MDEVEQMRLELCQYFCDDEQSFKLDECITVVDSFCKRFITAHNENKERDLQMERAAQRKQEREKIRIQGSTAPSSNSDNDGHEFSVLGQVQQTQPTHRVRSASITRRFDLGINEKGDETRDLMNILLQPSTNLDTLESIRFNSLRINRRKSKNYIENVDRERSPLNCNNSQPTCLDSLLLSNNSCDKPTEETTDRNEYSFVRRSRTRSSCPSRVQKVDSLSPVDIEENNKAVMRNKDSGDTAKHDQLDKRLSREIAMKAASYEQQIRELESSLEMFNSDLNLNESLTSPKIQLSAPEKLEDFKVDNALHLSTPPPPPAASLNVKERMKRLTQLYSGLEPQEVEMKRTHNYGREVNATANSINSNVSNIKNLHNRDSTSSSVTSEKHYSDKLSDNNFKDEGFDSEEFSNTSTSQKSSRNSSRERDSGSVNINVTNDLPIDFQKITTTPSLNNNFKTSKQEKVLSLSSTNVKPKQIIDRSNEMHPTTARSNVHSKISSMRPTTSGLSTESQKTRPYQFRTNFGSTIANFNHKPPNAFNRTASKPASRVTPLAAEKSKQEKEKRVKSETIYKTSNPPATSTDKKRTSLRDSSASSQNNFKSTSTVSASGKKQRSSSATGVRRRDLQSYTNAVEAKLRHTRLDPITNLTASFLLDSTKKQPHLSRDDRPKNSKPSPPAYALNGNKSSLMKLSTLSLNGNPSDAPRKRNGSSSSNRSNLSNTTATNTTTQKSSDSSFVRGSTARSTMPTPASVERNKCKLTITLKTNKPKTLLDRPSKDVAQTTTLKMTRPIKPTMLRKH
ncbi:hypothetical protein HELRODRAFT_175566 [Helobdella robusta]|uniref:FH2 domain-containing protein n=1 Tax=Helobdella robusta TaxID=6412 RepID=T1F9D8_HELRO|nr:hypothetical protein HELRODRAFT_175566 [Helobdella robusta]ESO00597.1 hypothetical protein HELRODRAFT_175566 [Helobdella robusta]